MIRVLLVIPNFGMGGAQRSFAKLANWLSERYEVSVVVFDDSFKDFYSINAKIYLLSGRSGHGIFSKFLNFLKRVNSLKKIKKVLKPYVTISFLEGADYLNMLCKNGSKRIISIRGSKRYDPHIKGVSGWIRKKILIPVFYRRADIIVTASEGLLLEVQEDYPCLRKKLICIPNGYDIKTSQSKISESPYFVLVWAGRFGDEKGLDELIAVFSLCMNRNSHFRLLLLGDGYYKQHIINLVEKHSLKYTVSNEFHIHLFESVSVVFCNPGDKYDQYLSKGDVFLLTSPSEGFPNVLIEALQQRLVVVSTDCKWGPREILAPDVKYNTSIHYPFFGANGILLPTFETADSIETWTNALIFLYKERELLAKYSKVGTEAVQRYSAEIIKNKWFEII